MNRRRLLLAGGALAAFALGVTEVLAPGQVPLPANDVAITLLGLAVLAYGLLVLRARSSFAYSETDPPAPEHRRGVPTPGEDFDEALVGLLGRQREPVRPYTRQQLRRAAVLLLQRFEGLTEDEATRAVDDGSWTDDSMASTYLSAEGPAEFQPLRTLRALVSRETVLGRYRRHTVAAMATLADVDEDSGSTEEEDDGGFALPFVGGSGTGPSDPGDPGPAGFDGLTGVDRRTNHWFGVSLVAVVCLGVGAIVERPALVVGAVVGVGFAAYARSSPLGSVDLAVERTLDEPRPEPDDEVEVTVTVTNRGSRTVPDLRLIDGVPDALAVTDGQARLGTMLRPGESASITYTVRAHRGTHEFEPAMALVRNWPGTTERRLALSDGTTITCVPTLSASTVPVPLRSQVTRYTGSVDTNVGGEGLEFFATRRYQPGDARNRIDWNRLARTGELATLEFREERSASVVLLIDVRDAAYVAPGPDEEHAVDRSVRAAGRAFTRLLDDGNRVGIATMGSRRCWLAPGSGGDHRHRGERLLATDPALSTTPTDAGDERIWWHTHLRRQLPADAQVIVFSPLTDRRSMHTVRELEAWGNRCTVVSPDPTAGRTPGQVLVRIRRRLNVVELRSAGVPVIDWPPERSFETALARHVEATRG